MEYNQGRVVLYCIVPYRFYVTLHTGRRINNLLRGTKTGESTCMYFLDWGSGCSYSFDIDNNNIQTKVIRGQL